MGTAEGLRPEGLQERIATLLEDYFPEVAGNPVERARRFLEEGLETAQAVGVSREQVEGLVERVWSRPAGNPQLELNQACLSLLALAQVMGRDAQEAAEAELQRLSGPGMRERMRARHAAKVAEGVAE